MSILIKHSWAILAFLLANLPQPVRGDDRYYLLLFGTQTEPVAIRFTHTFALFVKATGDRANLDGLSLETQTISWMPSSLSIRVLSSIPEPGVNLSLKDSLDWGDSVRAHTTMYGPYEVKRELYDMAARQVSKLSDGSMQYLCNDRRFRGAGATNCIHAVADLDSTQPPLATGRQCGNAATIAVLDHFNRYLLPTQESNQWLCDRVGLDIKRVRIGEPRTKQVEMTGQLLESQPQQ